MSEFSATMIGLAAFAFFFIAIGFVAVMSGNIKEHMANKGDKDDKDDKDDKEDKK